MGGGGNELISFKNTDGETARIIIVFYTNLPAVSPITVKSLI